MYLVIISPHAKKELKKISLRYSKAVKHAIEELHENPYIGKPLTRDLTKKYSYRIGVYRIIYKISKRDKVVNIITAGHRATIYNP